MWEPNKQVNVNNLQSFLRFSQTIIRFGTAKILNVRRQDGQSTLKKMHQFCSYSAWTWFLIDIYISSKWRKTSKAISILHPPTDEQWRNRFGGLRTRLEASRRLRCAEVVRRGARQKHRTGWILQKVHPGVPVWYFFSRVPMWTGRFRRHRRSTMGACTEHQRFSQWKQLRQSKFVSL